MKKLDFMGNPETWDRFKKLEKLINEEDDRCEGCPPLEKTWEGIVKDLKQRIEGEKKIQENPINEEKGSSEAEDREKI